MVTGRLRGVKLLFLFFPLSWQERGIKEVRIKFQNN